MTYRLSEQQKEAIRVLRFDLKLKPAEIVQRFAKEQYPITESQVKGVTNIQMKNKSQSWCWR